MMPPNMDIVMKYYQLFVILKTFYFACDVGNCQEFELLNEPLTWNEANNKCSLVNDTKNVGSAVPLGVSVWIRKRRDFTKWLAVEDCGNYILSQSLSTEITIDGLYPVLECQEGCLRLFQSVHVKFGMKIDGTLKCICDNPNQTPDFGTRTSKCNSHAVSCNQRNPTLPDLCGDGGGRLVVYNQRSDVLFQGGGECGAFRRDGVSSFSAVALPCNDKNGYLQVIDQGVYKPIIPSDGVIWTQAANDADIRQELKRFSSRDRVDPAWHGISLQEWPLNVSLWVGVIRGSKPRQSGDQTPCVTGLCYCAAIHVHSSGATEEKLMDCTTTHPALCIKGSIRTTTPRTTSTSSSVTTTTPRTTSMSSSVTTTTFRTTSRSTMASTEIGTTSHSTLQTTPDDNMDGDKTFPPYLEIGIAGILLAVVVILVFLYVLIRRRKIGFRKKANKKLNNPDSGRNTTIGTRRAPTEHSYVGSLVLDVGHNYQTLNVSNENRRHLSSASVQSDRKHLYVEIIDSGETVAMEMNYETSHTQLKEPY